MSVRLVARIAVPAAVALALIAPQAAAATRDRTSPAAPVNLRITATTSSSVSLAWDAGKSGSGISHYTVLEKTRWSHFFVPATETTFNHARLTPNSTYSWVVYAVDRNGKRSADSNTVTYGPRATLPRRARRRCPRPTSARGSCSSTGPTPSTTSPTCATR